MTNTPFKHMNKVFFMFYSLPNSYIVTLSPTFISYTRLYMSGHNGSGQYAHQNKNKDKLRNVLNDEYQALDADEQQIYKDLAIAQNAILKGPSNKKRRGLAVIDKIRYLIDEAEISYGISCAITIRMINDDNDDAKPETSFCMSILFVFIKDAQGSLQGLYRSMLAGSLKHPPYNYESAARSYKDPIVPLNTIQQFHALGNPKPSDKSTRDLKGKYLGDYMRYLFKCTLSVPIFIEDVYFDLVVDSNFTFGNGPKWKWVGFPENFFAAASQASKVKADLLNMIWDDTALLKIKIVANVLNDLLEIGQIEHAVSKCLDCCLTHRCSNDSG